MKNLGLISLLNLMLWATILFSCGRDEGAKYNSKVMVFTDRSKSCTIKDSAAVFDFLVSKFNHWFKEQKENVTIVKGTISDVNPGLTPFRFRDCPPGSNNIIEKQNVVNWKGEKLEWLAESAKTFAAEAANGKSRSSYTEIFSLFKDIDREIARLKDSEKLYVVFLSDMVHDDGRFSIANLTRHDVIDSANQVLNRIKFKSLTKGNLERIEIWIVSPTSGKNYSIARDFWTSVFEGMGFTATQFQIYSL